MAETTAEFSQVLSTLQKTNQEQTDTVVKQRQDIQQSNLLLGKTSRGIETLMMATTKQELGTGKYDEQIKSGIENLHKDYESHAPLDPTKHEELLFEIREAVQGSEQTLGDKIQRFVTNNLLAFTNMEEAVQRLFGADIFEKRRQAEIEAKEERARELAEESYRIGFLNYKLMSTDVIQELRAQTDALEGLLRRTPTRFEREEAEMEAARRQRRSIEQVAYKESGGETRGGSFLGELFTPVVAGAGAAAGFLGIRKLINSSVQSVATKITGAGATVADDAVKAATGAPKGATPKAGAAKLPVAAKDVTKTVTEVAKSGLKTVGRTVLGVFGTLANAVTVGKDVFDIASAVTDDDIRNSVKYEDIGAVVGSIVGGAVGFAFGGNVALGVAIGNVVGESIGAVFDEPDVKKNLEDSVENLKEQIRNSTGAERDRLQKELDVLVAATNVQYKALEIRNKQLDDLQKEKEIQQEIIDDLEEGSYARALEESKLRNLKIKEKQLEQLRKEDAEALRRASIQSLDIGTLDEYGVGGFFDQLTLSDNALFSFIGNLADSDVSDKTKRAAIAKRGIESLRSDASTDAGRIRNRKIRSLLSKFQNAQDAGDTAEAQRLDAEILSLSRDFTVEEDLRFLLENANRSRQLQASEQLKELAAMNEILRDFKASGATIIQKGGDVIQNQNSKNSTTHSSGNQKDKLTQSLIQ